MRKTRFLLAIISMFFLWLPVSQAQMKTVSGTIIAEDNQSPLSGATVKIRGTRRITQTDANGKFSIQAAEGEILQISFGKVCRCADKALTGGLIWKLKKKSGMN